MLEIGNSRMAADRLDDDEKADIRLTDTSSNGVAQARTFTAINEAGMYRLVLRSDKPAAKRFQKWVVSEVLPSIRRTGGYGVRAPRELTRMEILQMAMESETKAIAYQRAAEEAAALAVLHEEEKVEAERKFSVAKGALVRLTGGNAELHSLTEAGKQAGVNPGADDRRSHCRERRGKKEGRRGG